MIRKLLINAFFIFHLDLLTLEELGTVCMIGGGIQHQRSLAAAPYSVKARLSADRPGAAKVKYHVYLLR
jgi:hypothetical protein